MEYATPWGELEHKEYIAYGQRETTMADRGYATIHFQRDWQNEGNNRDIEGRPISEKRRRKTRLIVVHTERAGWIGRADGGAQQQSGFMHFGRHGPFSRYRSKTLYW